MAEALDTDRIKEWRSIVTLITFVLTSTWKPLLHGLMHHRLTSHDCTDLTVLFPFKVPVYVPLLPWNSLVHLLRRLRIKSPQQHPRKHGKVGPFTQLQFPMNFVTAPLLANLFLLAISAIGRQEVYDGTVGADNISPIDIMAFFLSLAYIAISIDASGLIRWLALKALEKGGKNGHALFLYLYAFFLSLGSFIGNDPIILSGTAFLAYMTRVSENIYNPRAWIHTQFTVANVVSALLVSSNPTNLVLAGAFNIKFVHYTANMIVPVAITAIILFPFLRYVVFSGKDEVDKKDFIPYSIALKELPPAIMKLKPANPNITHGKSGKEEEHDKKANNESGKLRMAEEIMNPYLDRTSATVGAIIMSVTLVTILVLNAVSQSTGEHPVYWVTVPAAFVMFSWDVIYGWLKRDSWRQGFQNYQEELDRIEQEELGRLAPEQMQPTQMGESDPGSLAPSHSENGAEYHVWGGRGRDEIVALTDYAIVTESRQRPALIPVHMACDMAEHAPARLFESPPLSPVSMVARHHSEPKRSDAPSITTTPSKVDKNFSASRSASARPVVEKPSIKTNFTMDEKRDRSADDSSNDFESRQISGPTTLQNLIQKAFKWLQERFPTVMVVIANLPFPLVPFALSMFALVQGLVTKGWVPVFAYGWDHWVDKTGTVGAIGGMGFLSVILCNVSTTPLEMHNSEQSRRDSNSRASQLQFAGTNIGSAILLSRVVQAWQEIHRQNGIPISDRTFWATVYSLALGVNFGAFSAAFSASLAGLLWRDILQRKYIEVKPLEFAKVNLPIISMAMAVGCAILVAEVYIVRDNLPYDA